MVNRIMPVGPASAYQTYQIASPLATHYRDATCREVDCERHVKGWNSALDMTREDHAKAATWIRMKSGRAFTVTEAGPIVTFTFPAGQTCFEKHKVPVGRPELYLVRGGDWRGNPRNIPVVRHNADTWVDDFANHQDRLKTEHERG